MKRSLLDVISARRLRGAGLQGLEVRHTSALLQAATAGLEGAPFEDVAAVAVRRLREVLGCESTAFYEAGADGRPELRERADGGSPFEPLDAADPQLVETLAGTGSRAHQRRSGLGSNAPRTDLTVAVRAGTKTFGVLAAAGSNRFRSSDREFIRKLASILALARRAERRSMVAQSLFARSRHVFDNNPNPMMLVEAATLRYIDVNLTAIRVYGYTREQWLTMTPYDLRAPEDTASLAISVRALTVEGSTSSDARHRKADGSSLDAHLSIVTFERDGVKVYIVTVQDVTERNQALARSRRSEATLARAQRQLEHSALHDRLTGFRTACS